MIQAVKPGAPSWKPVHEVVQSGLAASTGGAPMQAQCCKPGACSPK